MTQSRRPRSRRILASAMRAQLADILEAVGEHRERVLIDRRGKPPVALVSVDDLLQLELIEARDADRVPVETPRKRGRVSA